MSKMSQIAMELEEQAAELGFASLQDAIDAGYEWRADEVDGVSFGVLYKPEKPKQDEADRLAEMQLLSEQAHAEAHLAWLAERELVLAERELVLGELDKVLSHKTIGKHDRARIEHAINFIRIGEM